MFSKKKITILLPARFSSTRIKNKLVKKIKGIPLILHTIFRVKMIKNIHKIIICTDNLIIKNLVEKYGLECVMTSLKHENGTDRIAEASKFIKADLFVDIHADEAVFNPKDVEKLINFHLNNDQFDIVVPHKVSKISGGKNIVKMVFNNKKRILYFSRSEIPFAFRIQNNKFYHHLDFISFKPASLKKFRKLKHRNLEKIEGIELMRALENEMAIGTFQIKTNSFSINTPTDFSKAKKYLDNEKYFKKYHEKIKH